MNLNVTDGLKWWQNDVPHMLSSATSSSLPFPHPLKIEAIINILNQYMSFLFNNSIHLLIALPCMIYCILEIDLYVDCVLSLLFNC